MGGGGGGGGGVGMGGLYQILLTLGEKNIFFPKFLVSPKRLAGSRKG